MALYAAVAHQGRIQLLHVRMYMICIICVNVRMCSCVCICESIIRVREVYICLFFLRSTGFEFCDIRTCTYVCCFVNGLCAGQGLVVMYKIYTYVRTYTHNYYSTNVYCTYICILYIHMYVCTILMLPATTENILYI